MENKPNYFIRVLLVLLVLALSVLVGVSFSLSEPKYGITSGIITIVFVVVILVLSEAFNQLSIGKLLILSKEVTKKEEENKEKKEENKELRQSLFNIVTSIQHSAFSNHK